MLPELLDSSSPALRRAYEEVRFAQTLLEASSSDFARGLTHDLENMIELATRHQGAEEEADGEGVNTARALIGRAMQLLEDHPAGEHLIQALAALGNEEAADLPGWVGPGGTYEDAYEALCVSVHNLEAISAPHAYGLAEKVWHWYRELAPAGVDWLTQQTGWSAEETQKWLDTPHPDLEDCPPNIWWRDHEGWYDVLVLMEEQIGQRV